MKTIEKILERIREIDQEKAYWSEERRKDRDNGYAEHCSSIIDELRGEKNGLEWVLKSETVKQPT